MSERLLPESFFARECLEVALGLLGKLVRHGSVTLRITELEAYRFPHDTASHCHRGRTPRNAVMWGPPGRAYVYLCYGMHQMFNVVADVDGHGSGVLIRACEPVSGLELITQRRGGKTGPVALTGPGKVASALKLDTRFSGHPLFEAGGVELLDAPPVERFLVGPRVGIDFADPGHRAAPWRLAVADTRWVSERATLTPYARGGAHYLARERHTAKSSTTKAGKRVRAG
ncbi:MAG: DNA-3-methyladenine glycosylase [Myxococcales bacterium]